MASPKFRDYFITINEEAECYNNALEIVKNLNTKLYAYIIHDRDFTINEDGELKPKKIHKHIVVELVNPITFESAKNKFKGAHIETIKYKKSAYQYLLHESPNSKEKYHYTLEDIISNNLMSVKLAIEQEEGLEIFKETLFLEYIVDGTCTSYQFAKRFGLNVYKQYWNAYSDMLEQSKKDIDMINDIEQIKQQRLENQAKQIFEHIETY